MTVVQLNKDSWPKDYKLFYIIRVLNTEIFLLDRHAVNVCRSYQ